jgi:hypothetical protein
VLLPVSQPLSAGLVLRCLASGSPLVIDPLAPEARVLTAWLAAQGMPAVPSVEAALESALAREPRVRAACGRGREIAALHEPDALAMRLAEALGRGDTHESRAA